MYCTGLMPSNLKRYLVGVHFAVFYVPHKGIESDNSNGNSVLMRFAKYGPNYSVNEVNNSFKRYFKYYNYLC